jgi:hypothetical protein
MRCDAMQPLGTNSIPMGQRHGGHHDRLMPWVHARLLIESTLPRVDDVFICRSIQRLDSSSKGIVSDRKLGGFLSSDQP